MKWVSAVLTKVLTIILTLSLSILFFAQATYAKNQSPLAKEAQNAIYDFFASSSRKVQTVEIESYSRLSTPDLDYLVEAEVKAESPVNSHFISYHCGVFLKKVTYRWQSQQTVCEALP